MMAEVSNQPHAANLAMTPQFYADRQRREVVDAERSAAHAKFAV